MTRQDLSMPPEIEQTKRYADPSLHDVFIDSDSDGDPVVRMMHKAFLNYQINFRSRNEVDEHIKKLKKFRDKAFPKNKSVKIKP